MAHASNAPMPTGYSAIIRNGLWDNNVVLAQILGMCPTMAVTSSATNGLGMGLATTFVLVCANMMIAALRKAIPDAVRIPVFIVLIAGFVTILDLSINAFLHDLYKVLGLYIALIVANCAVLGRAEAFAFKNPVLHSGLDGLAMGLGFTLALTLIGGIREVFGAGTLFSNAHLLLGPSFAFLETTVIPGYKGFLMMLLPPGGFLTLGLLLAARRIIEKRRARNAEPAALPATA